MRSVNRNVFIVGAVVSVFLCGALLQKGCAHSGNKSDTTERRDTVRDTVRITRPEVVGERIVRHDTVRGGKGIKFVYAGRLPDKGGRQSLEVLDSGGLEQAIIPISQQVYRDSNYTAFVSGYHATLDSLKIVRPKITITRTVIKYKQRNWGIGVQVGYGITPKGFQPYLGIGGSWRFW